MFPPQGDRSERNDKEAQVLVEPSCDDPSPLEGEPEPAAPGFIVIFKDKEKGRSRSPEEVQVTVSDLADEYDFEPASIYSHALEGFAVEEISPEALARIRCEPAVDYVQYNSLGQLY